MLGIIYYWNITINYDKFDSPSIYIFDDEKMFLIEYEYMKELNDTFAKYTEYKSGDKFRIGNYIKYDSDIKNLSEIKYNNAYFIVTYNTSHCVLELYSLTDIPIDTADILQKLSKIKLTNLAQPYNGSLLNDSETFMNNDYWCLYNNTNIHLINNKLSK